MKKLINHFRRWNIWRKNCTNPWHYKLFVLLGIVKSPTMILTILPEEIDAFMLAMRISLTKSVGERMANAILGGGVLENKGETNEEKENNA